MIAHLNGKLIHKSIDSIIVDVGGVGYEVFIPLSTFYMLPELHGGVALKVYTQVKEDAITLYGFLSFEEKEAFQLLISVSGVGPRLARNILSGIAVEDLVSAISSADKAKLSSIPGIGAKSAERLILELKDKVKHMARAGAKETKAGEKDAFTTDVVSALENLGYKSIIAEEAVKKAKAASFDAGFEGLLKEALKHLSRK